MNATSLFRGTLVRLAALQPGDAPIMARWNDDSRYARLVDSEPACPRSSETASVSRIGWHDNHVGFTIRTLSDDRLIGYINLFNISWTNGTASFGMGIGELAYRSKGYGSEALFLLLRYAFTELNLYRVGLDVLAYNAPAIRAYEKAGFQHEGAVRGAILHDGERSDLLVMAILRHEWLARHASDRPAQA